MDITILQRLVNGIQRNVDISSNTLVTQSIKVGGNVSNTELTKTILDNLISHLTNTSNPHSVTKAQVGLGSVDNVQQLPMSYLDTDDTLAANSDTKVPSQNAIKTYVDTALSSVEGTKVKVSATDTTAGYLNDSINVSTGSNTLNILQTSYNPGTNETLNIQIDPTKIDHGTLAGLSDDDHTQYIKTDGTRDYTGDQSMGGYKITSLGAPTAPGDAVSKSYVDAVAEGLKPKQAVLVATTSDVNLSSPPTSIDGVAVNLPDVRILVKDQTSPEQNGIYVVTSGLTWIRASDFDALAPIDEINGALVAVQSGTQNAGKVFVQTGSVTTIDTSPINFVFFNSSSSLVGGDGITVSGSNISIDTDGQGLDATSGQLALELDGATLSKSSSGLKVADSGIDTTQLADGAVHSSKLYSGIAGAGLQKDPTSIYVVVDNATIGINGSNQVYVPASGITSTELADNSVITNKIQDSAVVSSKIADGAVVGSKIDVNAVDENKISNTALGPSLTGGSGLLLNTVYAPKVSVPVICGESFAGDNTFCVRMAMNGETAGRVYKADYDATSADNFYVYGIVQPTGNLNAGDSVDMIMMGVVDLMLGDTAFAAAEIGQAVHLKDAGSWDAVSQITYASNQASYRIGIVKDTNQILVGNMQLLGIN